MANEKLVEAVCEQFMVDWLERCSYLSPVIHHPDPEMMKRGLGRSGLSEKGEQEARAGLTKALLEGTDVGKYLSFPGWTHERSAKVDNLKKDFAMWWNANRERLEKAFSD
jgi:hypothetical protein